MVVTMKDKAGHQPSQAKKAKKSAKKRNFRGNNVWHRHVRRFLRNKGKYKRSVDCFLDHQDSGDLGVKDQRMFYRKLKDYTNGTLKADNQKRKRKHSEVWDRLALVVARRPKLYKFPNGKPNMANLKREAMHIAHKELKLSKFSIRSREVKDFVSCYPALFSHRDKQPPSANKKTIGNSVDKETHEKSDTHNSCNDGSVADDCSDAAVTMVTTPSENSTRDVDNDEKNECSDNSCCNGEEKILIPHYVRNEYGNTALVKFGRSKDAKIGKVVNPAGSSAEAKAEWSKMYNNHKVRGAVDAVKCLHCPTTSTFMTRLSLSTLRRKRKTYGQIKT